MPTGSCRGGAVTDTPTDDDDLSDGLPEPPR